MTNKPAGFFYRLNELLKLASGEFAELEVLWTAEQDPRLTRDGVHWPDSLAQDIMHQIIKAIVPAQEE